jgi:Domain of unknown function (DUF3850)
MTEHVLKTLAPYWDAIADGSKTFEVRRGKDLAGGRLWCQTAER